MQDIYDYSKSFEDLSKSKDIKIPKFRFTEKLFVYEPFKEAEAGKSWETYDQFITEIWKSAADVDINISLHPTSSLPEPQMDAMFNGNEELVDFDSKDLSSWIFQKETINFIIDKELELNNKILFFTRESIWGGDIDKDIGKAHISLLQPTDVSLELANTEKATFDCKANFFVRNFLKEENNEFIKDIELKYQYEIEGSRIYQFPMGKIKDLPQNNDYSWIIRGLPPNVTEHNLNQIWKWGLLFELSFASKDAPEIVTRKEFIDTMDTNPWINKYFKQSPLPDPVEKQTYDKPIVFPNPSTPQYTNKVNKDVYILHSYKPFKNTQGQFRYAQIALKKVIPYAFKNKTEGYLKFSFFKTPIQPKNFNEAVITFEGFTLLNRLTFLKQGNVKARYEIQNRNSWQFCLCNPKATGKTARWYPIWYSELEYQTKQYSKAYFKFNIGLPSKPGVGFTTDEKGDIWFPGIINGNLKGGFKNTVYATLGTASTEIPIFKPLVMNFSTSFNELRKDFSFVLPKKISIFNMGVRDIRKKDDKLDTDVPQTPVGALLPRVWRDSDNTPWKQTQDALYVIDGASRFNVITLLVNRFQNFFTGPIKNDQHLEKQGKDIRWCYYNSPRHQEDKGKLLQGELTDYIGTNWGEVNQLQREVQDFSYNQDDMNNVDVRKADKHLMLLPVNDLIDVKKYVNEKFVEMKTDTFVPGGVATTVLHNYINPDPFKEISFEPKILEEKAPNKFQLRIKFDEVVDVLNQLEIKCIGGYKIGIEYFLDGKSIPLFPNTEVPIKFGVQEYLAPNLSGNPLATTITKQYATSTTRQNDMTIERIEAISKTILKNKKRKWKK